MVEILGVVHTGNNLCDIEIRKVRITMSVHEKIEEQIRVIEGDIKRGSKVTVKFAYDKGNSVTGISYKISKVMNIYLSNRTDIKLILEAKTPSLLLAKLEGYYQGLLDGIYIFAMR